jgi:hypothetical protein
VKKIMLFIMALMLLSINAKAGLRELIQQNVKDAEKSYEQIATPREKQANTLKLWVNISDDKQTKLGEDLLQRIANRDISGNDFKKNPVQIVEKAPSENKLRYYKKQDEAKAKELLSVLKQFIPDIKLEDFSGQFSNVIAIQPGHMEVWISPKLRRLESSQAPLPGNSLSPPGQMQDFGPPKQMQDSVPPKPTQGSGNHDPMGPSGPGGKSGPPGGGKKDGGGGGPR